MIERMSWLLDLDQPYVYLLYTLLGAAFTAALIPALLNTMDQAERDALRAHPALLAFAALAIWAAWPLLVVLLFLDIAGALFRTWKGSKK